LSNATNLLNQKSKIERHGVVATDKLKQLLNTRIPKIDSGSDQNKAMATYDLLMKWGLEENVIGMSFDTTAKPSVNNGASIVVERMPNICLLRRACIHHVFELVGEAVFSIVIGTSFGLYNLLCSSIFCKYQLLGPIVQNFEEFQKL
jgi:hypothetical protein